MLRSLFGITLKRMDNKIKAKQTIAKTLNEKMGPTKLKKHEVAEVKSQLFNELKNKKQDGPKLKIGSSNKSKVVKSKVVKNEIIPSNTSETKVKRTTRNKVETADVTTQLDVTNIKSEKIKTKNKIPIDEEPCGSKKITVTDKWEPPNWKLILENIRTMRCSDKAPVDTMGCHKCADENADEKTQRFHKLVALMLSSQTKDETTYHAMLRLREYNLTPEMICNMKVNVLENILHPVSFYKNKAKYLQQTSKILIEKYNSDIPNNIKELVALPGVGPKMAHICMSTAWQEVTGIGVDVHVHRISNRLGWLPKPTKDPEQTRLALEAWLPQDLWSDVNYLLVGFGQTVCTPVKPKCSDCLNCLICPSAPETKKKEEKRQNSIVLNLCDKAKFKKSKIHL